MNLLSQALDNEDSVLFSESDILTENECNNTSDADLSDSNSGKNDPVCKEGETKKKWYNFHPKLSDFQTTISGILIMH